MFKPFTLTKLSHSDVMLFIEALQDATDLLATYSLSGDLNAMINEQLSREFIHQLKTRLDKPYTTTDSVFKIKMDLIKAILLFKALHQYDTNYGVECTHFVTKDVNTAQHYRNIIHQQLPQEYIVLGSKMNHHSADILTPLNT